MCSQQGVNSTAGTVVQPSRRKWAEGPDAPLPKIGRVSDFIVLEQIRVGRGYEPNARAITGNTQRLNSEEVCTAACIQTDPDVLPLTVSHSPNMSNEPAWVKDTDSLPLEHSDDHSIMQESFIQFS